MEDVNIVTKGVYYHNYVGFIGISTKKFEKKIKIDNEFYSQDVYCIYNNRVAPRSAVEDGATGEVAA